MSLQNILGGGLEQASEDLEEKINAAELLDKISFNISKLPPQRQLIFQMSRYEHLSNQEIAQRLDLSVRTVEKHIQLAIKDLKNIIN